MTAKVKPRMVVGGQDGWQAEIRVWRPDGRLVRERVRAPGKTRADAQKWASQREAYLTIHGGEEEEKEKVSPTFEAFAARFLAHARTNNKPSTAAAKGWTVEKHLLPTFGKLRLDAIGPAQVEAFKAAQQAAGRGLSNKTINNQLGVLGRALALAVEWGELARAPKIKALKVLPPPIVFLDFDETDRFLAAADAAWAAMLTVALRTGLRAGELRALQWSDVDLSLARLTVRRSLWRGRMGAPKGGRARTVDLCGSAVAALRAQRLKTGIRNGFVFSPDGGATPFSEEGIAGVVGETAARVGIEKTGLGWHTLRHSCASQLVMRGVALRAVQLLLGHATIQMTERYAHLAPAALASAVQALDLPAPKCGAAGGQAEKADENVVSES